MIQKYEHQARPDEIVHIIDSRTLQVQGQRVTAYKVKKTNFMPERFTILGQACPDDDCMMAFFEEGPGNSERAIAKHRRMLPERTEMINSNTKWTGAFIAINGTPYFTLDQYNAAIARSQQAERRKHAKEKEKRKKFI